MKSHAAKLMNSDRLLFLLNIFLLGEWYTTKELEKKTGSTAVHTDIHELRKNGVKISPAKYCGVNSNGRKIYKYRLEV